MLGQVGPRGQGLDRGPGRGLLIEIEVLDRFDRGQARGPDPEPGPERDALIAATAAVHGLTVVTRNVSDFEPLDVAILDPWQHGSTGKSVTARS